MSNRYVTTKELEGHRLRANRHREKLAAAGLKPVQFMMTDAEKSRVKELLQFWRTGASNLAPDMASAAAVLQPASRLDELMTGPITGETFAKHEL
jgi:hypothetical protein